MVSLAFILLTALAVLFYQQSGGFKANQIWVVLSWCVLVSVVAGLGLFEVEPTRFVGVMAGLFGLVIFLGRNAAPVSPQTQKWLLALHSLRLGVEWVLHELYGMGKIPKIMTWEGYNFDVAMGISALMLLVYTQVFGKSLSLVFWKTWNATGLCFLIWIVGMAALSAPLPLQQLAFDQPNVAILSFPFCLLPGIVVPLVGLGHWRALRSG